MQAPDVPTRDAAQETVPIVLHITATAMDAGIMVIIIRTAANSAATIAAESLKASFSLDIRSTAAGYHGLLLLFCRRTSPA